MKKMKRIALFAIVLVGFTACSKEEQNYAQEILGKWDMFEVVEQVTSNDTTYSSSELYDHLCNSKNDYLYFKSGGVIESAEYGSDCGTNLNVGTWNLSGKALTISYGSSNHFNSTILLINNDKMTMRIETESTDSLEVWYVLNKVE